MDTDEATAPTAITKFSRPLNLIVLLHLIYFQYHAMTNEGVYEYEGDLACKKQI
jgi:hypothetical protein